MRLFFAINLRHEIKEELLEVLGTLEEFELDAAYIKPEQVHLTLLFIGEVSDRDKNIIQSSVRKVKFPKFNVSIKGAGFFPTEGSPKVFWIGARTPNDELVKLHAEICKALDMEPQKDFTGHITLARIRGGRNINELIEFKQEIAHKDFGEFEIRRFDLVKSEMTNKGTVHTIVERFELE